VNCGGCGELATCAERPGDPGVSTAGILTSKLKTLNVSFELATDMCEHGDDERKNKPGGPIESPISIIPVCGEGALPRIPDQAKESILYASELWTLALFLPFLSLMPWAWTRGDATGFTIGP
jgi:hypothetical protein